MSRIETTPGQTAIAMHTAAASLPALPTSFANVLRWATPAGTVAEFDLEIWAAAALTLTVLELMGAVQHAGVIADTTFTTTHAADTATDSAHGLATGDGPVQLTTSGTLPGGLSLATDYYIIKVDDNTYQFASSLANALAGTAVAISSDGTGTHTLMDTASTKLISWHSHGFLGSAASGSVVLGARKGYTVRCGHRPNVIAYALTGTLSASTISAAVTAVERR